MPKDTTATGTNQNGNSWKSYSDGSYYYKNSGTDKSSYFGHSDGSSYYTNSTKGYATYTAKDGYQATYPR